jgi:Flp pilus assembly protein TadD
MNRAIAMTAASALCLLWTAGCASTGASSSPVAASAAAKPADGADAMPNSGSDVATLARNLPATLDGEIRRAQLLRSKGDYDEAARSLAQIMLVAPDNGRVVGEYGKVLEQQGHSREALPFLQRAVQLQPNDASIQSALGVAYDQLDQRANARAAYERALALNPGDASVLNNYAVSRMLAGDYAGAQRLFVQARAQDSSNPKIAGNLEKLATLNPAPAAVETPVPSTAHAQAPAPAAQASQSVVKVGAVVPLQHPPASVSAKDSHPTSGVRVAVAGPKALGAPVVMQRVPHDPLAGPVHGAASKTASAKAHKPVHVAGKSLPQPETPSLRTAADAN